jgi:outer membrane protein TolC
MAICFISIDFNELTKNPFPPMPLKKFVLLLFCFHLAQTLTYGDVQKTQKIRLNLQKVIDIAQDSSLHAFIDKNRYLADYWDYRTYKARFLPTLNLHTRPFNFTRAVTEEYNWEDSSYQYIEQQDLNSYFNLSVNQNIALTGGRLYLDSDFGRIQNFYNDDIQYSATPIRIGYRQGLFDFNWLKWQKKIAPLKFQRAKRNFIQQREEIAERSVRYFFNLLLAQISLEIEKTKYANADTLYKDGKRRFKKDSVSQEDLYSLELSKIKALNSLQQTENWVKRAENRLIAFLRLKEKVSIELISPDDIPQLSIEAAQALAKAHKNNPNMLWHKQRRIQAEQNVVRAKKRRYNADLSVSFGLNQSNGSIKNAYDNLLDQEKIRINVNIPIVDWGLTQKRYNLAKKNQQVINAQMEQSEIEFDQDIKRTVDEFNLQKKIVRRAAQADTLASKTYELVKQRFMGGKIDIVKLNSAQQDKISSRKKYIEELEQYWDYYYEIRQMTMYDFCRKQELTVNFSKLTQSNGLNPIRGDIMHH